jgi:outer membrane lipoprotein-sorting protein
MNFANGLKIFLLCALMFVAACGIHDGGHSTNSGGSGSATPAATDANPTDAMAASIKAQFDAKSYRIRIESLSENYTTTAEYVAPDRFHMAAPMNETIIVGADTYVKPPTGRWQKLPINANQMISMFRDPKLVEELRNNTSVKFLGTDSLEGMPVKIYEYTVKNAFGTNMESTSKAWIAASDNLPRKMEIEANVNGKPSKMRITYYDYNADIKIVPPM